jgi:hypothetical protein
MHSVSFGGFGPFMPFATIGPVGGKFTMGLAALQVQYEARVSMRSMKSAVLALCN